MVKIYNLTRHSLSFNTPLCYHAIKNVELNTEELNKHMASCLISFTVVFQIFITHDENDAENIRIDPKMSTKKGCVNFITSALPNREFLYFLSINRFSALQRYIKIIISYQLLVLEIYVKSFMCCLFIEFLHFLECVGGI